ncbi:hypothetical protein K6V78_03835 [Streptococcus gallolyticus]|uniref:hypothetical protein n=1 Tax=Streptococcus hepaticus TaxID=3349163 RepID=UPI001C96B734|nr:hypothetical protein [Streptococcus gallolyticus]MBY5040652.1 hypothetical protein [Streptococcus gallolyticus]
MKKNKLILALGAMLFASMLGVTAQADTPLYRLYNKGLKVHLYTKDTNEYAVLATRGWSQEGVAWNTEDQQGEPVYRLYNRGLKVHLYTKDANEYAVLATRGWAQEGVAFRSFGETPVYRLYNRGLKKHLYTKDANEYAVLATRGWAQEGVAFMALSNKKVDAEKPVKPAEVEKSVYPAQPEKVFGVTVEYKTTDGTTPFNGFTNEKNQSSMLVSSESPFYLYQVLGYKVKSVTLWTAKTASNGEIEKVRKLPYSIPDTTQITYEQFEPLASHTGANQFFVELVWEKDLYAENPTEYDVHVRYIAENGEKIFKGQLDEVGSMSIGGVTIRRGEVASLPKPSGYKVKSAILMTATSDAFGVHKGEIVMAPVENNQTGELPFSTLDKLYVKTKHKGLYIWEVTWGKE